MMFTKSLLTILVTIAPSIVRSQPVSKGPGDDTSGTTTTLGPKILCDINGGDSTYNETIDGELRLITASGCPNHYSECTGKGGVCVEDETEAAFLDKSINIPAYPCFNNYTDDSEYNWAGYPVYCLLNNLGIALNGVSFFSPSANTECKDAIGQESESFDTCGGHAGPGGGYHYHAGPACLLDQLGDGQDSVQGHSPQIGWAYDGFPVYGPHGQDGEYILLCTQNNSNSSDCLDNCSGHRHHTIDGFKYHYHIAGPVGDLESSPLYPVPTSDRWPYTFGCFRGIPSDWSQTSERGTPDLSCVESGVTDDYEPQPVDGVTDVYYYPAQDIETRTVYPSRPPSTTSSDTDTDVTPSPTSSPESQPGSKGPPDNTGETTTTTLPVITLCDINGGDSTYNETIDGELRLITATGCPNHYSECTGKGGVCVPDETEAAFHDKSINIPAYPCFNNYTDDSEYNWAGYPVYCLLNNLGIALNGVSFFSPSANTNCKDAIGQESESFDTCGGHAGPGGSYHYHAGPACLLDQLGDAQDSVEGHSPQIGWAYDGFPVYGPHGLDGEYILLCTQNNSNPSDCLDNCSGHRHHTIDGFKYHYHIAGPVGDLETSPLYPVPTSDRWPYTFGCYKGIPSDWSQTAVRGTPELECVESGVTDDYIPRPVDGVTDVYYYPAQDIETRTIYPSRSPASADTTSTPTPSPISNEEQVQITGWVYTDNSFELYFNEEKVATGEDNVVYINFTAPVEGFYSFAFWAQDNSNDLTGLEPSTDGSGNWCVGDGGIIMQLSDGTVTSSDWRCKVVMEGPLESECQTECAATPSQCTVQNNAYPSCWNETSCPDATYWSSAIEYTTDNIDWSVPSDKDWGDSVPIWTSDLDLDNTIICRYSYEKVVSSSPATTEDGSSDTTESMTTTRDNGANEIIGFYAFMIAFIGIMI